MHINPNQIVTDFHGNAVKEDPAGPPMTLGVIAITALLRPDRDPRNGQARPMPYDVQAKRFQLAVKFANATAKGEMCPVDASESTLLKELLAELGMPIVAGRFYEALNGIEPANFEPSPVATVPVQPTLN